MLNLALESYPSTSAVSAGGYHVAAAKLAADSDGDLLDNAYEGRLGSDPERVDSDGDGLDDATEVLAGFDPTKATEAVDGTATILPAVTLRFFTLGGQQYRIQTSQDLITWRNLGSRITNRNGFTVAVVSATGESLFYRLFTLP